MVTLSPYGINREKIGHIAYESYYESTGGRSLATGQRLPGWESLGPDAREAWMAVATEVAWEVARVALEAYNKGHDSTDTPEPDYPDDPTVYDEGGL